MKTAIESAALVVMLASAPVRADLESWYLYSGIGSATYQSPSRLNRILGEEGARAPRTGKGSQVELLGLFWPHQDGRTLLGGILTLGGKELETYTGFRSYSVEQQMASISAMHFYGKEPGEGFFLRGDVGATQVALERTEGTFLTTLFEGSGPGALVGVGYGFAISGKTRILVNATYSSSWIDRERYSAWAFHVAGLW